MFDGLRNLFHHHKESKVETPQQQAYNEKVRPMKDMLFALSSMIHDEIHENHKIEANSDYQIIVRNPANPERGAPKGNNFLALSDVHKSDLESILQKVGEWAQDKSPTQLPLLPREIELLQQIANAIEKKELVIKQNNQFITNSDSEVYNALLNQSFTMEKADHLAQQKIIGRKGGKEGEIVVGEESERENLIGVYDVFDTDAKASDRYFGEEIFGTDTYRPEEETLDYSEDEIEEIKQHRGNFTKKYKEQEEGFINKFQDLGTLLKQQYETSLSKLENDSFEETSKEPQENLDLKKTSNVVVENVAKTKQEQTALDIERASKSLFRKEERTLDREARIENDKLKRLEHDLDAKFDRIQQEQKEYDIRHEDDPPKKAA